MPLRIFFLEDHTLFRELIVNTIKQSLEIEIVGSYGTAEDVLANLPKIARADVGLLDVRLATSESFELLPALRRGAPSTRLMWVTSVLEDALLKRALDENLPGFVHKDDSAAELITAVRRVAAGDRFLSSSVRQRRDSLTARTNLFTKLLSAREQELLKVLATGYSNAEAAALLGISPETVKTHRRNIMARLQLHSASELQAYALRNGFVATTTLRWRDQGDERSVVSEETE